ncbi:cell wall hydrolase [Devosia sp. BK]|uniref:cell wall hydrolase n=2 Tax=unclassified Devosia TaxID=196773 RepID=UPI0009EBFC1A|nr:cell wall hydrolase [Devosia sp. BK]
MAHPHRPVVRSHAARAVRRSFPVAKTLALGLFASVAYMGFAGGAFGPSSDLPDQTKPELALASLSYTGAEPVITGSVDNLFKSISFTGPNRSEKTDRYRPPVDVAAFSKNFEQARMQIAALRDENVDPNALGQSRVAALENQPEETGPRMSVASIDPATAAALDAIAGIAPQTASLGPVGPMMPAVASEQLAYARANAPVTGAFSTMAPVEVSDREKWCLATAIYFEARGESYRGQVAVAQVVMNRVKDHRYPSTICGVVFQNQDKRNACQFSFACDGIPEVISEREPWVQAEDIANRFLAGELYLTEVGTATHYHATYVSPKWAPRMEKVTQIGLHVFYKFKRGWLFG